MALLAACSCMPGGAPDGGLEGGEDAGKAAADAGKDSGPPGDGGRDAGMPDASLPDSGPPVCWDAGALDSGLVWTGFGGTCSTLVAPLAWCSNGMDLCPLLDGGTAFANLFVGDNNNCGACGLTCGTWAQCDQGQCLPEVGEKYLCPTQVPDGSIMMQGTNLDDDDNCGGCNCPCATGQQCLLLGLVELSPPTTPWGTPMPLAECVPNCTNGEHPCARSDGGIFCTDLNTDGMNCGACGIQCCPGNSCANSACPAYYPDCRDAG
jgi:hypothetical protein